MSRFTHWMIDRNVEYARTEGVETVTARLRAHGYHMVAEAVEKKVLDSR